MGRILLSLLSVSAFVLLSSNATLACTCDLPLHNKSLEQQIVDARKDSKAVFSGKVVEVIENPKDYFYVVVRLRIERSWKNVRADEVLIVTGRGGGDCGYRFEVGESYLVYAYGSGGGRLETNICQRARKLADAGEDIKMLGKGRIPRKAKHASVHGGTQKGSSQSCKVSI
ncbi:MAG: hypothetical protein H0W76_01440 [Pyrinomonadaceae bacterium]|nr:hypothetical protein [Pyrinomonadaceae bacterium]